MNLNIKDLTSLLDVACEAALKAGKVIKGYSIDELKVKKKDTGSTKASQVVTEVDINSQRAILDVIQPTLKLWDLALLSEELDDDGSRFKKDYFWAIDPLDGTLPFVEGKDGYAVSISLISRTGTPVLGVVFDPTTDTLYHAIKGNGAFRSNGSFCNRSQGELFKDLNGKRFALSFLQSGKSTLKDLRTEKSERTPCHFIVDRSLKQLLDQDNLRQELVDALKDRGLLFSESLSHRGSVMNACQAMDKPPACYFKPPKKEDGGGCIWDFAATSCIFTEAGGVVSDYFGHPLNLNSSHTVFMNRRGVMFATTRELGELCIQALKDIFE
jgi:fructose-1,6-bisphosphatase/inositol monophosphatase family enzyme